MRLKNWQALVAVVFLGTGFPFAEASADAPTLDIYLARHGQTAWNAAKCLQGATDNPLDETGRTQARQLGERLRGLPVTAVYSSSLTRARETAALAFPEVTAVPLPELAERSFGKFEGMPENEPNAALAVEFARRSADPGDAFDGGESLDSQAARVARAVERIRRERTAGSLLVVSHGGVTPLILAHLLDLPAAEAVRRIKQANDELYLVRLRSGAPPQVWKLIERGKLEQL